MALGLWRWDNRLRHQPFPQIRGRWIFFPGSTATNSVGGTVTGFGPSSIAVSNATLSFTANPAAGAVPLMVTFSSSMMDSTGSAITQWNWDFGDGTTGVGPSPYHTYATAGIFYPVLTATNSLGGMVIGLGPASIIVKSGLVLNGGFETGDFTGWNLFGGDPTDTYVDDGSDSGVVPHSANYVAALGSEDSLSYLSQTLATTPGATYTLSFWLDSPDGQTPNEFLVSWNGITFFDDLNIGQIGWTNLQFSVSASGTNTVLQFGFRDDPGFLGLDDVSVEPAPGLNVSIVALSNSDLVLTGTAGVSGQTYYVLMSTNLAAPRSAWVPVATNVLSASGNFIITVTNTVSHTIPERFYMLETQ